MALPHLLTVFSFVFVCLAIVAVSAHGTLVPKPKLEKPNYWVYRPKPTFKKPILEQPKEVYSTIGVQGIIYCQAGPKLLPLQGAVARITCMAKDKDGYETDPFTLLSMKTDQKGYFFATLPISQVECMSKNYKCKAFLDYSPWYTCNVPTDINKGLSGSVLNSTYHIFADQKMKLYSVGPFVFSSTKPTFAAERY
ncbi:hypothetical protein ACHQM5_026446 [Ranunculus cassubicifolius]